MSSGSFRVKFDITRTHGSSKSAMSSICTWGLDRPSKVGDFGGWYGSIKESFVEVSSIGFGRRRKGTDEPDDEDSDDSLIAVNSLIRENESDTLWLLIFWLCAVLSSGEGVPSGDNGT